MHLCPESERCFYPSACCQWLRWGSGRCRTDSLQQQPARTHSESPVIRGATQELWSNTAMVGFLWFGSLQAYKVVVHWPPPYSYSRISSRSQTRRNTTKCVAGLFCLDVQLRISTYFWNACVVGLSGQNVSTDVVERAGPVAATLPRRERAADVFGVILAADVARRTCFT